MTNNIKDIRQIAGKAGLPFTLKAGTELREIPYQNNILIPYLSVKEAPGHWHSYYASIIQDTISLKRFGFGVGDRRLLVMGYGPETDVLVYFWDSY